MRVEIDQMADIIRDYLQLEIPAKLVSSGLKTIENYLDTPPTEPNNRQLAVYMSDGIDTEDSWEDGFIVQAYLPGEINAHKWMSVLYPVIRRIDPLIVGHTTKMCSYLGYFPGESDEGGGATILYFELKFSTQGDSCDMEQ